MSERVRVGSARPGVRRAIVAELRSEASRIGGDILLANAADEIESLERKISRIGGVLVDVLEWADRTGIQPPWLDALTAAVEDEC